MKLGREVNRTDKATGQVFYRWKVTLSNDLIEALGWEKSDDLTAEQDGDGIRITRRK